MKGIALKQDEVSRLQIDGKVTIWRDVKPQPFYRTKEIVHHLDDIFCVNFDGEYQGTIGSYIKCPYIKPGEVRFVRETFMCYHTDGKRPGVWYKIDQSEFILALNRELGHRWSSPATMPEWASRYRVSCKGVTVEKRGEAWQWGIELEKVL